MLRYQKGYIFNGYTFVVNKEDVHNAKDDMFVEATALLPDGWISVKDRLPEDGRRVLTYGNPYYDGVAAIDVCTYDSKIYQPFWEFVTRWMYLPEPPKEARP